MSETAEELGSLLVAPRSCILCFEDENNEMLKCNDCDKKVHIECIRMSRKTSKCVSKYYCQECRQTQKKQTIWNYPQVHKRKEDNKDKLYFEVEGILDHRFDNNQRKFLIKWKSMGKTRYPPSWEPENFLDGCPEFLQTYCENQNLEYSDIDGFVGAKLKTQALNTRIWVKMSTILNTIRFEFMRSRFKTTNIKIEIWTSLNETDSLYLLPYQGHCYVILHYAKKKIGYISDGGNKFKNNDDINQIIQNIVEIPLIPRTYVEQTGVDHCGTSAIIIGLQMIRQYYLDIKPDKIIAPQQLKLRLKTRMHNDYSAPETNNNLDYAPSLKCSICGKKFKKGKRKNLKNHEASHKRNN